MSYRQMIWICSLGIPPQKDNVVFYLFTSILIPSYIPLTQFWTEQIRNGNMLRADSRTPTRPSSLQSCTHKSNLNIHKTTVNGHFYRNNCFFSVLPAKVLIAFRLDWTGLEWSREWTGLAWTGVSYTHKHTHTHAGFHYASVTAARRPLRANRARANERSDNCSHIEQRLSARLGLAWLCCVCWLCIRTKSINKSNKKFNRLAMQW